MAKPELPPPVTRESSKKALWHELECARAEIEVQQELLNDERVRRQRAEAEVSGLRYQMSMLRAVLAYDVKAGHPLNGGIVHG